MINTMDWCRIVSRKGLKDSGLSVGEIVFVASSDKVPFKKNDPYLFRQFVRVFKVDERGIPLVPKTDNEHMSYIVDPRWLEKLPKEKQDEYSEALSGVYAR